MTSSLGGLCLNASYKERGLKPLYIDYRNALIYLLDCFSTLPLCPLSLLNCLYYYQTVCLVLKGKTKSYKALSLVSSPIYAKLLFIQGLQSIVVVVRILSLGPRQLTDRD